MKKIMATIFVLLLVSVIGAQAAQPTLKASGLKGPIANPIKEKIDEWKELVPKTYEAAEYMLLKEQSATLLPRRFLMWTGNGEHIMWGHYGKGYFVGQDNAGENVWGIWGKNVFAGFYNDEFFYGRYASGKWSANYLFGEEMSRGRYVTFPSRITAVVMAE